MVTCTYFRLRFLRRHEHFGSSRLPPSLLRTVLFRDLPAEPLYSSLPLPVRHAGYFQTPPDSAHGLTPAMGSFLLRRRLVWAAGYSLIVPVSFLIHPDWQSWDIYLYDLPDPDSWPSCPGCLQPSLLVHEVLLDFRVDWPSRLLEENSMTRRQTILERFFLCHLCRVQLRVLQEVTGYGLVIHDWPPSS